MHVGLKVCAHPVIINTSLCVGCGVRMGFFLHLYIWPHSLLQFHKNSIYLKGYSSDCISVKLGNSQEIVYKKEVEDIKTPQGKNS